MDTTDSARPRPVPSAPPPPPPPGSSVALTVAASVPRPAGPVDPRYGAGYFVTKARPAQEWEDAAVDRSVASPSALKPLAVVLVVMAAAAIAGFFGWKAFFGPNEIVYRGANGTVDAVPARTLFVPVEGFTYRDLPGMAKGQVDTLMSQVAGVYGVQFEHRVKGLMKGGQFSGAIVTLGMAPAAIEASEEHTDIIGALESQVQGAEIEQVELGGKPALKMQSGPASTVLAFYENQIVVIATADEATTEQVATTILGALP